MSFNKKNKSTAAHVPFLYNNAGYGHVWYVVDCTTNDPGGNIDRCNAYHFLNADTGFRSIEVIVPSLRRFSPKIDESAIGNLNERGIGPDWITDTSRESESSNEPQTSERIKKFGYRDQSDLQSFTMKGFGSASL